MDPLVLRKGMNLSDNIEDYPGGIIIPVDKPYRWTSADVIRKIKSAAVRHFHKKNLKVGHAGTLDPLATGVLLVCIGNATKLAETLQSHDKEYIAGVTFGATTPSYDLEKDIDMRYPHEHITEERISEKLQEFLGEQEQVAPLFSAKSVDGVRAYELARKLYRKQHRQASGNGSDMPDHTESGDAGQDINCTVADSRKVFDATAEAVIKAAKIRISDIELLDFRPEGKEDNTPVSGGGDRQSSSESAKSLRINVADTSGLHLPTAEIRIECSKGTYIRAFARDLGEALDSGAHLCSLVRSRSGDFRVEDCLGVEDAVSALPFRTPSQERD